MSAINVTSNATEEYSNVTFAEEEDVGDDWVPDDATWILCSSFIIFTMQTGSK